MHGTRNHPHPSTPKYAKTPDTIPNIIAGIFALNSCITSSLSSALSDSNKHPNKISVNEACVYHRTHQRISAFSWAVIIQAFGFCTRWRARPELSNRSGPVCRSRTRESVLVVAPVRWHIQAPFDFYNTTPLSKCKQNICKKLIDNLS